ncbi:allophanate hydrolase [halophilic archaeon]|nr:allophanate hydrolase [halophilic archaeon]
MERTTLPDPRYEHGADDHVFVELAQEMSFEANFKAMSITKQLRQEDLDGVTEICPANASYLVRVDPDVLDPSTLIDHLQELDEEIDTAEYTWEARVIDVPILYDDPWTHETLMQFRDRHQDPDSTDLEYAARINDFDSVEAFIDAHTGAPHMVTMIGFVPGLPWCFQMVPRDQQIEVPKYVQPRTETPSRAVGYGGAFTAIYPVKGAGGYQLFGRTPVEVFDGDQSLPDFQDSIVFPNPGDILNFRSIDRDEYDAIREDVENGTFTYSYETTEFKPSEFYADPDSYNRELQELIA